MMEARQLDLFTEFVNIPWAGVSPRVLTKSYARFSLDARARAGRSETLPRRQAKGPLQRLLPLGLEVLDGETT